MQTKSKT